LTTQTAPPPGSATGRYGSVALLLGLGLLWGTSYLFIKVTVATVPPLTLVAGRLSISAAIMWAVLRVLGYSMPHDWRQWGPFAVMGLFNGILPYTLITWGEQYIPSGLASLLQSTMPIFTVILVALLSSDERITLPKVLGVAVGFAGVGFLMLPDLRQGLHTNLLGQLAVVVSSLCYATAGLFARSRLRDQSPFVATTGQLTMGALFALPLSLVVDRPFHLALSWPEIASWLGLCILGTVVAYCLYYLLIARTSATFVSTVTYIIPLSGLALGAVILGESLSVTVLGSLGLILLGVLLVKK
jgi:drug/metabolite transporter (DMT)-like permease